MTSTSAFQRPAWVPTINVPQEMPQIIMINPKHITSALLRSGAKTKLEKFLFGVKRLSEKWFSHVMLIVVLILYCGLGAWIFQAIEGPHEKTEKVSLFNRFPRLTVKQL